MQPEFIADKLEKVLHEVQRPARYVGGEVNSIVKEWSSTKLKIALAFPDIYDLGMPNLGLAILYDLINQREDMLAERVYLPWQDMERVMLREDIPLYSLESYHPVGCFDILGVSLPYEQLYTNTLHLLKLSNIPYRSADRVIGKYPLVVAGGHSTFNPEPMADFIDVFVIGEGEEAMLDIAEAVHKWCPNINSNNHHKAEAVDRTDLYRELAQIDGIYVPQFYRATYHVDGTLKKVVSIDEAAPLPVLKRIVKEMPPPVTKFVVPFVNVVHNRAPIEIMRGCTRGCRFCQAGMITRPVRERSVDEVVEAIRSMLKYTGYEEVALLSLSSSDYQHIGSLVEAITTEFGHLNLNISLPSLRIETVSVDLMDKLQAAGRRGGFTLAPEAASERMREIINKPVSTKQLLETAREIYSRGWTTLKLYFMIGHPSETLEDVQEIADLAKAVLAEGRKVAGGKAKLNVGVSTFVPKPHTPFQWSPSDSLEQIKLKQRLLRREVRGRGLKLNLNKPHETMMESWLSRGDRRLGNVILEAYKNGAKFDGWWEHFNYRAWIRAFEKCGLDTEFYTHRERKGDEGLPWDHIDSAVKKSFLLEDYQWSKEGETRIDCRDQCFACGILPQFIPLRKQTPADAWECPEVKPRHLRGKKRLDIELIQV
ncbi:MAG: B12-binding domain-containing radical SAM protein [Anaerolineaceae bacterium]|nr:B12-binding domain-containing radical SAM protein [Anaerolineaceae bacterium]|tara:strand:+ start:41906 stop:43864 length:1959 start_codon:yes stop_codon:yes gene_type:complete